MIGREAEWQCLSHRLQELVQGSGGAVVIEADAGMGKSRLIAHLLRDASSRSVAALAGRGQTVHRPYLYRAWRPVFRLLLELDGLPDPHAMRTRISDYLTGSGDWLKLAPLLGPVVGVDWPDTEFTAELAGQDRIDQTNRLLVQILRRALQALDQQGRHLLIVMEDAQWCDAPSWAVLWLATQHLPSALLVVTTRPVEGLLPSDYRRLLDRPSTVRLPLGPLSLAEIRTLLCESLQVRAIPDSVVSLIAEQVGGNPAFSVELCHALFHAEVIHRAEGECRILPGVSLGGLAASSRLHAPVARRRPRLPFPVPSLQSLGQVIGHAFALRMTRDDPPGIAGDTLLTNYLTRLKALESTDPDSPTPDLSYSFRHLIAKEVAYSLTAGDLLPHRWGKADLVARAVNYFEQAGQQAAEVGDYQEAEHCFGEALARVGNAASPRLRARWEKHWGDALYGLGQADRSIAHYEQAVALAGEPVPKGGGELAWGILASIGRQALRQLGSARPRRMPANGDDRLTVAQVYGMLSVVYSGERRQHARGLHAALKYLTLAESSGDAAERAKAYMWTSVLAWYLSLHGLAWHYVRRCHDVARHVTDPHARAVIAELESLVTFMSGDLDQARNLVHEALELFTRLGARRNMLECWGLLAIVEHLLGRLPESLALEQEMVAVAQAFGDPQMEAYTLSLQALTLACTDRFTEVLRLNVRIDELIEHTGMKYRVSYAQFALTHLRRLDRGRALKSAELAARQVLEMQMDHLFLFPLDNLAEVYLTLWEERDGLTESQQLYVAEMADRMCAKLRQYARIFPCGGPSRHLHTGLEHWLNGRRGEAMKDWQRCLAESTRMGMRLYAGRAHYQIGRHLEVGDPLRREHLEQAVAIFARCGATHYLGQAHAALREGLGEQPCLA